MEIRTQAFENNAVIPTRHALENENLSPSLEWDGVPEGAIELVISCLDPDAPSGTWTHWLVAGIDPRATSVDEGKPPAEAIEGINDFGDVGYGGPRPPVGHAPHRYFFTVHALNKETGLKEGFSKEDFDNAAAGAEIASATWVGTFSR